MPRRPKQKREEMAQLWPTPNPALKELEVLTGEWDTEVSHAPWLPSPTDVLEGYVACAWIAEGAFLEIRQGAKPPIPASGIWLIGRDETVPEYEALYYDSRGVSRIYTMSFRDGVWKMWRNAPGFLQRFEGHISEHASMIEARWEKSSDGKTWEHDFDLTYRKRA